MTKPIKVCTDAIPEGLTLREAARLAMAEAGENIPTLTPGTFIGNTNADFRQAGVILTGKKWRNGRTLRVRFLSGSPEVINRIKPYFLQWSEYANIKFEFVDTDPAEIRVAVTNSGRSWSYLGTDALARETGPTMEFGWLDSGDPETEYSRVVLHEVGHALGMPHEHQHPRNGIPWDKEAVYRYYGGPPNNWSKETIDHNLFRKYSETITQFSNFDKKSIMLYAIPNELTQGDWYAPWNRELSSTDKTFVGEQYPKVNCR